jgi:tetratricopeptide (TPR) repeat protein
MAYAESCARLGRSERVEQLGDHLAQKHHATPWGPFYLAVAAEQRKELPRALWMINLALQRAPREGLLHYQKGRIHWALGEYKSAVESYRACVKESPRFVDAHLFLAQLHFRDQDYKNAVEHFLNVVRYEPESSVGAAGLGESYAQLGNIGSAIEFYERAVTAGPRNLTYRFRLAGLYENGQKNYESALNVYRKIKTLVSEQRTPAEEIPLDLNEKIRRLEDTIGKESNSRSQKKAEAQEAGIKKVNL